jgi:putative transposase
VILHSHQGCQYTSAQVVVLAESFFASLRGECLDQRAWPTRAAARRAIVGYIAWFTATRLHSAFGYLTPNGFEAATGKENLAKVA